MKIAIKRIAGKVKCDIVIVPQDEHLSKNQSKGFRCGDNGIFKGMPITDEQKQMSKIAKEIYSRYPYDGKYILDEARLIICQSNVKSEELQQRYYYAQVNPLGDWTGGINVDTGATNRKLGSDMADSVTGGGLHGKDLSKADVSVNIYAFLKAQRTGKPVSLCCAIGDDMIDGNFHCIFIDIGCRFNNRMTHAMSNQNLYCNLRILFCFISQIHNRTCNSVCHLIRMARIYFLNHNYIPFLVLNKRSITSSCGVPPCHSTEQFSFTTWKI